MPSHEVIERFLAQKHLAFVGVSRNDKEFANSVYRRLRDSGHVMYPVNDQAETVEGVPSYRRLADVPDPIDGVVVMVPAEASLDVVREAVARGIPRVWLHRGVGRGSVSEDAVDLCRDLGVEVVDGACPLMFVEPVGLGHKLHRLVIQRRFVA